MSSWECYWAMRVLGIETSCDDTSAALVENGRGLLASVVASQTNLHARYGGVVPEIASRRHLEVILPAVAEVLRGAGIGPKQVDAVAVTPGPGLVGALLVGLSVAKGLAWSWGVPLIPVHHLEAHVYAAFLDYVHLEPPLLALVVSGGHTDLLWMPDHARLELVGHSLDDAAGEAFDKVGRLLGLPYPGGPHVEKLAGGAEASIPFPRALLDDGLDFSFSGLKTAVVVYLQRHRGGYRPEEVAASFQAAVADVLAEKAARACRQLEVRRLVVAGGVAANGAVRKAIREKLEPQGVEVFIPRPGLCTDNAAMVAAAGYFLGKRGRGGGLDLNAFPGLPIDFWTGGGGR